MPLLWFVVGGLWTLFIFTGTWIAGLRFLKGDRAERIASGEETPASPAPVTESQREFLRRMERAVGSESHFITYPVDCVVGVLDTPRQAAAAAEALRSAGFAHEDVTVFRGHEGAMTIDPSGRYHGLAARLIRVIEAMSMDSDLLERYEAEAEQGHVVLAAHVRDARNRQQVEQIFRDNGGHLVTWFGRLHFEPVLP